MSLVYKEIIEWLYRGLMCTRLCLKPTEFFLFSYSLLSCSSIPIILLCYVVFNASYLEKVGSKAVMHLVLQITDLEK